MKLSIVLSTHPAKFDAVALREDFAANVARIAALGYDGVELAVRDPALVDAGQIKATLAAHRLAVPAIGTGQAWGEEGLSFTDPDPAVRRRAVERIKSHIELAAGFDALIILGLIRGRVRPEVGREPAERWLAEALVEVCQAGRRYGVRFVVEPINRYETDLVNTVAETLALIDRVGADNLGILLDTFHANIEEPSIVDSVRAAGQRLLHVHLSDSNRRYPGAGHTDFRPILAALHEIGYDGWLSAEILPRPDPMTATREWLPAVRRLLEKSVD
jgi:sugar phosphate isomerase/epimerase